MKSIPQTKLLGMAIDFLRRDYLLLITGKIPHGSMSVAISLIWMIIKWD